MNPHIRNTDEIGDDAFVTAVHPPSWYRRDGKDNKGKALNAGGKIQLWRPCDPDTGHVAIIPWEVRPRRKNDKGCSAKSRFVRANYVGIDYDKEGLTKEQVISNIHRELGNVECYLSKSTSSKKWHILVRVKETITEYSHFRAVRTHLAEVMGGDTGLQGFLFLCPTDRTYFFLSGGRFDASRIHPADKPAKMRQGSKQRANLAIYARELSARNKLIHRLMKKAIKEEGLQGRLEYQVGPDGCVNLSFPEREKTANSTYFYPDSPRGTMVHHFNLSRWGKGARYGKKLDSRLAKYVADKGIPPDNFNNVLNKCRKASMPCEFH